VLKHSLYFSVSSASLRFNSAFAFAFPADRSLAPAATAHKLHGGGITGGIRCTRAISVASAEPPADTKCQFSAFSRASRPPFRRIICEKVNQWAQVLRP